MSLPISFSSWNGEKGLRQFCIETLGFSHYTGQGISHNAAAKTAILRSVDNTFYYADDFSNPNIVYYTLFGHDGDQDEDEPRYNKPLLDPTKTHHIFVYRVQDKPGPDKYIWYGKYTIIGKHRMDHIGKDKKPRSIVRLELRKVT
jgi:hypothetical protein